MQSRSETIEEGIANIREAIELYVGTTVEDGLPIPTEDIADHSTPVPFNSATIFLEA